MPFAFTPDKYLHFYVGLPLGFALLMAFKIVFPRREVFEMLWAVFFTAVIGYGFELFSLLTGRGHHDVWDAVATVVGGIIGVSAAAWAF